MLEVPLEDPGGARERHEVLPPDDHLAGGAGGGVPVAVAVHAGVGERAEDRKALREPARLHLVAVRDGEDAPDDQAGDGEERRDGNHRVAARRPQDEPEVVAQRAEPEHVGVVLLGLRGLVRRFHGDSSAPRHQGVKPRSAATATPTRSPCGPSTRPGVQLEGAREEEPQVRLARRGRDALAPDLERVRGEVERPGRDREAGGVPGAPRGGLHPLVDVAVGIGEHGEGPRHDRAEDLAGAHEPVLERAGRREGQPGVRDGVRAELDARVLHRAHVVEFAGAVPAARARCPRRSSGAGGRGPGRPRPGSRTPAGPAARARACPRTRRRR